MRGYNIKWLVMDVDGTLTDGRINMGPNGEVFKSFDIKDGYAIAKMAPALGIEPVIITGRKSCIVENRCSELGVTRLFQGVSDKLPFLLSLLQTEEVSLSNVCYVGDDVNDLACIEAVRDAGGLAVCPKDAARQVREACTFISSRKGGSGVIREILEKLTTI